MRSFLIFIPFAVLAVACASAADSQARSDGGSSRAGDTGPPPAPGTWSYVYANDFAPGSKGHCANPSCRGDVPRGGFRCGPTKDSCFAALKSDVIPSRGRPLVDPSAPATSLILDTQVSPVAWSSDQGNMPQDVPFQNSSAKAEVEAWLMAGAKND
jgi:hypothetical protein